MMDMFQPMHSLVLIVPEARKDTTDGGLALPENTGDAIRTGVIRAYGPGRQLENGENEHIKVAKNDRVLFGCGKYRATPQGSSRFEPNYMEVEDDGVKCWLLNYGDVFAIIGKVTIREDTNG